jgi:hypothetical protein
MKRKNKFIKSINRFWEVVKSSKVIIILCALVIVATLMLIIMIQQRDIGAKEAGVQIEELTLRVRNFYRARPDYWGLSTDEVIKNHLYPDTMSVNGGKLLGYFANPVEIGMDEQGSIVMPSLRDFVIAYNDLTKAQCMALASDKFRSSFWLGLKEISIVSPAGQQIFGWNNGAMSLPISRHNAAKYCQNGSNILFRME